jgi:hypothetical protein
MDIDIRQIEDTRFVVSTQYTSDHVRDIPTKRRGKVVVFADELSHFLERNVASVSGKDSCKSPNGVLSSEASWSMHQAKKKKSAGMFITMISECVQSWARAPASRVGWRDVLWPTPPTCGNLSWCLPRCDEVVQYKTKVGLKEEEDLDYVFELIPTSGGCAAESIDDGGSHDGGRGRGG